MAMLGNYISGYNEKFLKKLEETDSGFTDEIYFRMKDCAGCNGKGGGPGCMNYNIAEYKGKKKINCALSVQFKMIPSDFDDVKKVLNAITAISERD